MALIHRIPLVVGPLLIAASAAAQSKATPERARPSPSMAKAKEPRMERVTSKDGTKIALERSGRGPAVVIVGGALTHRTLQGDEALVARLSEQFTVYTYDRRGRGDSADTQPYAVEREIEDIESIIERAGQGACVYGTSGGAALAMQAAAKLGPSKVRKLALYDTPYGQEKRAFDAQKKGVNDLVTTGKPGDAAAFFLSAIGTPPRALEALKASPDWTAMKKVDFTLVYDYAVLGDGAIPREVAKAIAIPTLVMNGEGSMAFMQATADQIAELVPHAERKILKGQAHAAKAEVVAPVLIEFFGRKR
jgi:pimeloyl-ACP methyl ester carboxylesterase